jgi:hypothetical protein
MHRIITSLAVVVAMAVLGATMEWRHGLLAADRHWQTGTWGDVTTERKMIDFGPGSSGFGPPGSKPAMRAMADVRRFVIETDDVRLEMEDTVPVGRRSIDVTVGGMVTFALEKKAVYVRDPDGNEHKVRLVKRIERAGALASAAPKASPKKVYSALGGGHVVRAVSDAGRYVTLEDGSRWEIDPWARYLTVEWESSANVTVRPAAREDAGFGYELINTSTDDGALANLVSSR